MRTLKEVRPIIEDIFRNLPNKPGKIFHMSNKDMLYRVAIETPDKQTLIAEISRKDIDDYFGDYNKKEAKKNIELALQNLHVPR
jgi:hypothetical protein